MGPQFPSDEAIQPAGQSRWGDLARKLAFEAAFVKPGSDEGLLPLNSLLMEMRDLSGSEKVPEPLQALLDAAAQQLEQVFAAGALFSETTAQWFHQWAQQIQAYLQTSSLNPPEASTAPSYPPAIQSPEPSSPEPQRPTSSPLAEDSEPVLRLAPEIDVGLLREFLTESAEHLQNIEQGILVLEENPADSDTLNAIFRAFHTFKGGAGFLDLHPVKDLAHELESLLDAARRGSLLLDREAIELILEGADALKCFVQEITARLTNLAQTAPIVVPIRSTIRKVRQHLEARTGPNPSEAPAADTKSSAETRVPPPTIDPNPELNLPLNTAGPGAVSSHTPGQTKPSPNVPGTPGTGFVKVDTVKLDTLIDLVGELVIAESMVLQDPSLQAVATGPLARNLAQLRRITSELQRTAMSLRMVPIRATFQKMHRLVRDLAARQGKQVQLHLSGEDTELDRNIVEALYDPLVHMIRNAVDHGIESPEERGASGKSPVGTIHLRAFHQGGNIVIQVADDGRGLNREKILEKARAKSLLKPDASLTDKEVYGLIFMPGFSTAEKVTEISGRGVGMDVVQKSIEKLRGKIDIESKPGHGTTFTIYLPLTLAIIDGLIVSVGDKRYVIPTLTVRESLKPRPDMIATVKQRGEMINVRGHLTPLVRLHSVFGHAARRTDPTEGIVVVVESGSYTSGLLVDELLGKQEVVIKSLGAALRENPMLAGGAVLGDGRVGLILNVDALVRPQGTNGRSWN